MLNETFDRQPQVCKFQRAAETRIHPSEMIQFCLQNVSDVVFSGGK